MNDHISEEHPANQSVSLPPQAGWGKGNKRPSRNRAVKQAGNSHDFTDASRGERLHKVLASAGVASRRACEELIREGAVRVNGHLVSTLPAWVDPQQDLITVQGKKVKLPALNAPGVCLMLFKPRGYECTAAPDSAHQSVLHLIADHPAQKSGSARLYPIGRLDVDSSGLLLLTNDGELAQRLTHPRYGIHKTYHVTVNGMLDDAAVKKLERGIFLPRRWGNKRVNSTRPRGGASNSREVNSGGGKTARSQITLIKRLRDRTLLEMTLREGRNRQIRRMMADQGFPVKKLRRLRIGPLKLTGLRPGQWRELEPKELIAIRRAAGLE